jgi:hypothetical protein
MADVSAQPIPDFGNLINSYGQGQAQIGQTNANTALTGAQIPLVQAQAGQAQAQTGLINAQSSKAQLEVQMIRKAMANQAATQNTSQDDQSPVDPTEAGVATSLNQKMYVDQKGPPGLQSYLNDPTWVMANPQLVQRADELRQIAVKSQTAQNQNEATDIYQTSSILSKNDGGHPLQSLLTLRPGSYLNNVGKAIASDDTKSPEEKDIAASAALKAAAKYSFQYTGQEPIQNGSQQLSKQTGQEVAGAPGLTPTPGEKIKHGEFQNTPQTSTVGNSPTTVYPGQNPKGPGGVGGNPPTAPGQANLLPQVKAQAIQQTMAQKGFTPQQGGFVAGLPDGFEHPPGNSQFNPVQTGQYNTWQEQAKKLADSTNLESDRAQDVVTHIKQINDLLNTPGLKLGPGSGEYAQFRTALEQWTGTPSGQAAAYQVLSKVLNTTEMNELLQQFHSEGAQVRLGAYESKLIMDKLTASPTLTKGAIQQMLAWQGSDAKYTIQKNQVAGAAIDNQRSVANFDKDYGKAFPKQDIVDTTASVLHGNALNFAGAKGKTYSQDEVSKAAAAKGVPLVMFQDQLTKAGATIK